MTGEVTGWAGVGWAVNGSCLAAGGQLGEDKWVTVFCLHRYVNKWGKRM